VQFHSPQVVPQQFLVHLILSSLFFFSGALFCNPSEGVPEVVIVPFLSWRASQTASSVDEIISLAFPYKTGVKQTWRIFIFFSLFDALSFLCVPFPYMINIAHRFNVRHSILLHYTTRLSSQAAREFFIYLLSTSPFFFAERVGSSSGPLRSEPLLSLRLSLFCSPVPVTVDVPIFLFHPYSSVIPDLSPFGWWFLPGLFRFFQTMVSGEPWPSPGTLFYTRVFDQFVQGIYLFPAPQSLH